MGFLNRVKGLELLIKILSVDRPALINLYGERRLGKTELLYKVAELLEKDYNIIYYQFAEVQPQIELENIQEILRDIFKDNTLIQNVSIDNWESMFRILMQLDNVICLFDEFPYLARADKGIPSILQRVWDQKPKESKTKILLCGSYVSFMEDLMREKQPLAGRFTEALQVERLNFLESQLFIPNAPLSRQIELYTIFGGNPYYLTQIQRDYQRSLDELFIEGIFARGSIFRERIPLAIRSFTLDTHPYFSILLAISQGKRTFAEIAEASAVSRNNLTRNLNVLTGLKMIRRVPPFMGKPKQTQYEICDPFTRFWFYYLVRPPQYPENYVKTTVMPTINEFISKPGFEEFCKEILVLLSDPKQNKFNDTFDQTFNYVSEYRDPAGKKQPIEIDLIAPGTSRNLLILAECKWRNKPPTIADLRNLKSKGNLFLQFARSTGDCPFDVDSYEKIQYLFFSRTQSKFRNIPSDITDIQLVPLTVLEDWIKQPTNPSEKLL